MISYIKVNQLLKDKNEFQALEYGVSYELKRIHVKTILAVFVVFVICNCPI